MFAPGDKKKFLENPYQNPLNFVCIIDYSHSI